MGPFALLWFGGKSLINFELRRGDWGLLLCRRSLLTNCWSLAFWPNSPSQRAGSAATYQQVKQVYIGWAKTSWKASGREQSPEIGKLVTSQPQHPLPLLASFYFLEKVKSSSFSDTSLKNKYQKTNTNRLFLKKLIQIKLVKTPQNKKEYKETKNTNVKWSIFSISKHWCSTSQTITNQTF